MFATRIVVLIAVLFALQACKSEPAENEGVLAPRRDYTYTSGPAGVDVTYAPEKIWDGNHLMSTVGGDFLELGKWMKSTGKGPQDGVVQYIASLSMRDRYGNEAGRSNVFTLKVSIDDLRRMNYERIILGDQILDFAEIVYAEPRARQVFTEYCVYREKARRELDVLNRFCSRI